LILNANIAKRTVCSRHGYIGIPDSYNTGNMGIDKIEALSLYSEIIKVVIITNTPVPYF